MKLVRHKQDPRKIRCDLCESREGPFHECQLPYGKGSKTSRGISQWMDLCPACIQRLEQLPFPFVTLDLDLRTGTLRPRGQG